MRRKQQIENPFEKKREYRGSEGYFKLQSNITRMFQDQNYCSICGSKDNLTVHHVIPCENYERLYVNKDNLIVICKDCHYKYHKDYTKVNPTTLLEFSWRVNNESY